VVFASHNELNEYMKVDGATSEDVFEYLFDVGAKKFLSKKEINNSLKYLRSGIEGIFNLIKILMII